jgi:hypothetical protein
MRGRWEKNAVGNKIWRDLVCLAPCAPKISSTSISDQYIRRSEACTQAHVNAKLLSRIKSAGQVKPNSAVEGRES